jgi:hypothetical protein
MQLELLTGEMRTSLSGASESAQSTLVIKSEKDLILRTQPAAAELAANRIDCLRGAVVVDEQIERPSKRTDRSPDDGTTQSPNKVASCEMAIFDNQSPRSCIDSNLLEDAFLFL